MDKQTLQAKYEELETEKAALNPIDDKFRITVIEQEQARLAAQIAEIDRLEQQAATVATVELPQDYDALWGVSGANDEIISLIQQAYEQAFAAGNDYIAQIQEEYQAKLEAAETERQNLAQLVESLQAQLDSTKDALKKAEIDRQTSEEAQADAEAKRDNAVALMEEAQAERDKAVSQVNSLKSQIDELENMLRAYKNRSASGGVLSGLKLTSTLPVESEEERKARLERERIEQINRGLARLGEAPLPLPTKKEESTAVKDDRFSVDQDNVNAGGLAEGNANVPLDGEATAELTLEQKVEVLWKWRNVVNDKLFPLQVVDMK
jgi:chromosome segregation ATPase